MIIIICVAVLILGLGYLGYYKWQQSQILLTEPLGYSVSCEESSSLEQVGQAWLESLIAQHQQPYLRWADRIDEYTLDSIKVLENTERKIVQIDFSIKPRVNRSKTFSNWSGGYEGNILNCQWVIDYDASSAPSEGMVTYMASNIRRPAAYDLEQYNTSGKKEQDEYEQEYYAEKPYDQAQYTYKIENEVCSVSYDGGASWVETPLPVGQLDYYVDGYFKYNELQTGSYIISPEKTVILYGGFHTPLTCLYSDDQGKTWNTAQIADGPLNIHIKFCSFPNANDGYIIIGSDKTMSWELETLFKTADGGKIWVMTGNGPRSSRMQSAGFIGTDIGFISYPYMQGAEAILYRTEDSGKTWTPVATEMDDKLKPYFTKPQTPVWQDGKLILLIDEGADSDYEGPTMQLQYTSDDMGKTWTYVQMLELDVDEPG